MTNKDRDDRDLDINDLGEFYEDGAYEEIYAQATFGERVDSGQGDGYVMVDEEEMIIEKSPKSQQANKIEEGFGEAINPDSNPHINDQLEDNRLSNEAEADYSSSDSGFLGKAKQKLDEWTDKDNRE